MLFAGESSVMLAEIKRLSLKTLLDKFSLGGGYWSLAWLVGALVLLVIFHHKIAKAALRESSPRSLWAASIP